MKINKRTAICFGIFLVLFMMTVGNAAAVQEEGIRTRIISNEAEQGNPDIDGDRIVWQDSRNGGSGYSWDPTGNWDIYMYDLSTSTETQITTNESCQTNPAIYGDKIVWQDSRNGGSGDYWDPTGNWDIYMYDISTSTETQITTNESCQTNPAIYGDKIVWQDDRNGNRDIYMYDLSTSTETRITTNESNQSEPVIYGDKIVWVDELRIDDPEIAVDPYFSINNFICVYDLSTSTETRLPSGLRIWNPSIYGDIIVWDQEDSIADNNMIVMYDLSTSTSNMIAIERTASPDIYKDRIVWTQNYGDFRNHVLMYNISTFTQTELTAEGVHESGSGSLPAIYGDRIVWVPPNNGINTSGIYMFTLASAEVPESPVADFATNVSEGSAPLSVQFSDLSKNAVSFNWDFGDGANSTEKNPVHTYSTAGIYTFNLTVTNENGTNSKLATINVAEKTVPDDNETDEGEGTGNETEEGTETRITTNGSCQMWPVIYEDRIVWMDFRNGDQYLNGDIYMYNISTSTETQITTNGSNQMWPDIYGDRIVWQDSRNGGSGYSWDRTENWDIYMYDLSTSTETRITTNESSQTHPVIYEDRIVWLDERNSGSAPDDGYGGFDVYMYNLSTKKETRITKSTIPLNPDMRSSVNIYDNKIVCYMGPYGISVYNLSTRQENVISDLQSDLQLYNLAISGNRIVGTNDWEGREGDVYMYDLSTATKTKITANGSAYGGPDISGNRIVWPDRRNSDDPFNRFVLYMYDTFTSTETQITSNASVAWSYPSIYGNRIVWEDVRNGNSDIYMFTLDSAEVPTPDGNETDEGNGTGNETQVPDNNSDNGAGNGTGNGTQVPDNNSDNGAGNETGNETQVPDNNSDNGTSNGTGNGTQVPDNCSAELMPLDNMQALKEYVECTYECHENTKIGLASLLDTSMCYCENGEDEKAVSMLNSFIHLAEKMKECKQVSTNEADYMIREAKKIIDQLEAN
ncbi:cell surface protein [Methanosarcina lacustris Z-7289]|uniref:Cell surface protein n=2 Tax=Methanosarcina lacustris TaxID=170861 RepID=A0A0E3S3Y8_9EURY|nr:cell surface protein [Methanosarcina lacustris Z-7289]